jgi:hypothetical protein
LLKKIEETAAEHASSLNESEREQASVYHLWSIENKETGFRR